MPEQREIDRTVSVPAEAAPLPSARENVEARLEAAGKAGARAPRAWARQWEFWLALAVGAFLRLWQIGSTQFLDDQARLMTLARAALAHGAIPLTGIPSSIGTYNPPLSVYLQLPLAAITPNPMAGVIVLALWNVAGVAFAYIFAERYFGRTVATVGALLFAAGGAAVNYSRFLWQQNYLPPLLAIWALTLFAGCVRGSRRWFAGNVLLLTVAILLHPTAALLAPVTLVGLLLAPRAPRLRSYAVAAAGAVILLLPTLIFQVISRGYDLRKLAHFALSGSYFDGQIGHMLYGALDGPILGSFGATPAGLGAGAWAPWVTGALLVLVVLGWMVLTARLVRPALPILRAQDGGGSRLARLRQGAVALWAGLRADAGWRAVLLLWLWVTVPPVSMLRHSKALNVHYLLVIFPVLFIVAGFAVQAALDRIHRSSWTELRRRALTGAVALVVAALTLGSGLHVALYIYSIASGQFTAYSFYGYPLDEMNALNTRLATLQREQGGARATVVLPDTQRFILPEQYLLVEGQSGRVTTPQSCLILSGSGQPSTLALSLAPQSPANALLAALPQAHAVERVPLAGGDPVTVYRVSPVSALPGDVPVTRGAFATANGNGLRLDAASLDAAGRLRLRWTVLGGAPFAPGDPFYRIQVSGDTWQTKADCTVTSVTAGETLITWLTVPASAQGDVTVSVRAGTSGPDLVAAGPLTFLTGRAGGVSLVPLGLAAASPSGLPGGTGASGYTLPLAPVRGG